MSRRNRLAGLSPRQLRLWLALFFLALALPTGLLVYQAYKQLKWEAFHQHRVMAEELADRIRVRIGQAIAAEEARGFADYSFITAAGDAASNYVARSPLSAYPVASDLPGVVGYFQVDSDGAFSTPLLPMAGTKAQAFGIAAGELSQRRQLAQQIQAILGRNRLVRSAEGEPAGRRAQVATEEPTALARRDADIGASRAPPAAAPPQAQAEAEASAAGQAVFDQLNKAPARSSDAKRQQAASALGRVEDLKLEQRFAAEKMDEAARPAAPREADKTAPRRVRKERGVLADAPAPAPKASLEAAPATLPAPEDLRIRTFESEIDPFEFSRLQSGHLVLFRKVWRDGRRYIQGLLIEQQAFVQGVVETAFRATALSHMSDLIVAYQGDVFTAFSGQAEREYLCSAAELRGEQLYHTRLDAPLGDLELIFSIRQLPAGPGGTLISLLSVVLAVVLCGGFALLYRLGLGQIMLARQQQDFVSAVSHELKTPLTSIRMYGEILREGWAPEEKKREYYDYIHDESERLSRLINNVLQLARLTRNELTVQLKPFKAGELMDLARSKIATQVERAGFTLHVDCPADSAQLMLEADADYFSQIVINLVDNAIKFSARADKRAIHLSCRRQADDLLGFQVRDYGPGIPRSQMKKIFRLFYRSENELTRETIGTGIGMALVNQLAAAMKGRVVVLNVEPGAEFRLLLPLLRAR
jgi:signal transduction histidine kinase